MNQFPLPASLKGYRIHLVGIKGTGMTALAEILLSRGALLSGSDTQEIFYTDNILKRLDIPFKEKFSAAHIKTDIKLAIHSAAYSRKENVELVKAQELGIPVISYPEAIGSFSERYDSSGISGTHGKTTTTALAGTILKSLALPVIVLVGSEVVNFGNRSSLVSGDRYFVAETCEYRRHFLKFNPDRIVLTGVELEHMDYFKDLADILLAFESYALRLPKSGVIIYNHDDRYGLELIARIKKKRADLSAVGYGRSADGRFRIQAVKANCGETRFQLQGFPVEFILKIPGVHSAYNAAAAIALTCQILKKEKEKIETEDIELIKEALFTFKGSRRRSEVLGEARGVIFMDDYGHHPTEITKTLEGLKSFYPDKRLIVDFMPHTYSRTFSLLNQFACCFAPADDVILHRIYSSAREKQIEGISGKTLYTEVQKHHSDVHYFEQPCDSVDYLRESLKPGDLFVTMGAGDNWKLGKLLLERFIEDQQ